MKVTADTFGGKEPFYTTLKDLGLLSSRCPDCGGEASFNFYDSKPHPMLVCPEHGTRSAVCKSFFEKHKIKNIPHFVFVLKMFLLGAGTNIIAGMLGEKEDDRR